MLKKVELENIFGIEYWTIDFQLKNLQHENSIEDQIILWENKKYALIPMFLAKNAAGKTSFIKALNFAMRFSRKDTFIQELVYYKMKIFNKASQHGDNDIYSDNLIKNLHQEVSFAGSNKTTATLIFDDKHLGLELTNDSFFIVLENATINIGHILDKVIIDNFMDLPKNQLSKKIRLQIQEQIEDIKFYDIYNYSLFRDMHPITSLRELMVKDATHIHINKFIHTFGFESFKLLLCKLDSNVKTIEYDIKERTYGIFFKNMNSAISPRNLSFGTQKVLEILSKSINIFKHGGIMMIDEIENGLHLSLIKLIVSFFSNPEINIGNAQLFLTTHNPLIAERNIVNSFNVFFKEDDSFVNIKNIKNILRTEDQQKAVKAKNYYSDLFWLQQDSCSKSTLSNIAINQIIDSVSESKEWQKR